MSFDPWIEVSASALAHNAAALARMAGGKPIIAVVKNNAYGLGLAIAGPMLDRLSEIQILAVVRPDEALALRRAGARKPILLMGPATDDEVAELVPRGVIQAPHRAEDVLRYAAVSERLGLPVPVQAYIDTGMHRMGMPVAQALPWLQALRAAGSGGAVRIMGAFTELVEDAEFDREQARRLRALHAAAGARGVTLGPLHAASSVALQHQTTETFLDAVRPGLALYGGYVSEDARRRAGFRPAYSLKARVMRVDRLEAGEGVSYHRRWTTDKPAWIATLAVGHVDGYPSGATKGGEVLVRGALHPVIGYVSASHTVIALGESHSVEVGDEATLVGPQHAALHPNEVARRAGYSEYDMFMHLSPTVRRVAVA